MKSPDHRKFSRGQLYSMPGRITRSLGLVFQTPVTAVRVVEKSLYARAHLGMTATTRPNLILVAISGDEFTSRPELLLHEYFHVLRQWNTGRLTRWRYIMESIRHGYSNNRFEREAREFTAAATEQYMTYLSAD